MKRSMYCRMHGQADPAPSPTEEPLDKFLLAEHEHIAQAHFNTVVAISQFFQYYILIASVPVSAAVAFGKLSDWSSARSHLINNTLVVALGLTILATVGLCVLGYVINLRHDALLYARTVNGIRRRFFDQSGMTAEAELRFRVLPRSTHLPQYLEPRYFLFVVLTFLLIDTGYCCAGWWVHLHLHGHGLTWLLIPAVIGVVAHLLVYGGLSRHREWSYLRGHIIGVDVDGVLGMHRERFCEVLRDDCGGPDIDPQLLDRMPVRDCMDLETRDGEPCELTEADEVNVFHQPTYWSQMKPYPQAAYVLQRLRDVMDYKILVFSWRPWPNWGKVPKDDRCACLRHWADTLAEVRGVSGWRRRAFVWICSVIETRRRWTIIDQMTARWLQQSGIPYDGLTIEKGNVYSPYPRKRTVNRFAAARRWEMRIFIEDDLAKALRLSGICDIVFLIDHPYNQSAPLPNNVIRVKDWMTIYSFVKDNM